MEVALYSNGKRFFEKEYQKESEFENLLFNNSKILFGEKSILIEAKKKIKTQFLGGVIPDCFLINLNDINNPEFYIVEVELAKHSFFSHIFPQITKFFAFFKNQENQNILIEKIYDIIQSDKILHDEMKRRIGQSEVFKYLKDMIENSHNILLVLDKEKPELQEIINTYTDTWGKMVKVALLKKYESAEDCILSLLPEFENIEYADIINDQVENILAPSVYTEEYHLKGVTPHIMDTFLLLKRMILDTIPHVLFNPQRYYISLRVKRNFAYIIIRRKKIRIVVIRDENTLRSEIKHYLVNTLSASVQKFYNGPCSEIVIENDTYLREVLDVLVSIQK